MRKLRGHWRLQWYPSQGAHKMIFVASQGVVALGYEKPYRGIEVDQHLDEGVLDTLNAIPEIAVMSTCEGHHRSDRARYADTTTNAVVLPRPGLSFITPHENVKPAVVSLGNVPETVIRVREWQMNPLDFTIVLADSEIVATPDNLAVRTAWWKAIAEALREAPWSAPRNGWVCETLRRMRKDVS